MEGRASQPGELREAVRRASVEQDGDKPGTLLGCKEARQARLD